jgi:hypothetical protein
MFDSIAVRTRLQPALSAHGRPDAALMARPPADPSLFERSRALLAHGRASELPIRYLGTMPLFPNHRVYPGRERDWVLLPLAADPLIQHPDGYPIPTRVLRDLRRIVRGGVDFDALYVAHETLPGAVREGRPIPHAAWLPPPPAAMQRLSRRLGAVSGALWTLAALPVAASAAVGGLLNRGAADLGVAVGLDPVLLGVVVGRGRRVRSGEPAAWFYLAHWVYNGEEG